MQAQCLWESSMHGLDLNSFMMLLGVWVFEWNYTPMPREWPVSDGGLMTMPGL